MPYSISNSRAYQDLIVDCLQLLNSRSVGAAMYILSCLCPEDFAVILDLVRLDLGKPHQHQRLPTNEACLLAPSDEELLSTLQAHASVVPAKDYGHFWLELTWRWLLTCPMDPNDCRTTETDEDLFCQKLRSELLDRILNIS